MDMLKLLIRMRRRLTHKKNWCRGNAARDSLGEFTSARGHDAVSWCVFGANLAEGGGYTTPVSKLLGFDCEMSMFAWNDDPKTTHRMVLNRLDKVILKLAKE